VDPQLACDSHFDRIVKHGAHATATDVNQSAEVLLGRG